MNSKPNPYSETLAGDTLIESGLRPQHESHLRLKQVRATDSTEWRYRGKLRWHTDEPRTPWWQVIVGWAIIGAIIWLVVRAR